MQHKVVNDAVAYIRGLAELRGRNAEWAEQAVRGAASLSANAALEQKVIDLIARDIPDLLARIDGREVQVAGGTVKLATREPARSCARGRTGARSCWRSSPIPPSPTG